MPSVCSSPAVRSGGLVDEPVEIEQDGGALLVKIESALHCSYSRVADIEDTIQELGDYASFGARFVSREDGEDRCFYVGSEKQQEQAVSAYALEQIRKLVKDLSPSDRLLVEVCLKQEKSV